MSDDTKISYALNQIIAPKSSFIDLINLAKSAGVLAIEIRNDIPVNLIEENKPKIIKTLSESNSIKILTVNALQKFNLWNEERLNELVRYSQDIWDYALNNVEDYHKIKQDSRRLQDEIYEHRCKSPLILNCIYKLFRKKNEELMIRTSEVLIEEANKAINSKKKK